MEVRGIIGTKWIGKHSKGKRSWHYLHYGQNNAKLEGNATELGRWLDNESDAGIVEIIRIALRFRTTHCSSTNEMVGAGS